MPGCGVYADEFVEEVRLTEGEDHADAAAHRLAHERHLLHPHLPQQVPHVGGQVRVRHLPAGTNFVELCAAWYIKEFHSEVESHSVG